MATKFKQKQATLKEKLNLLKTELKDLKAENDEHAR